MMQDTDPRKQLTIMEFIRQPMRDEIPILLFVEVQSSIPLAIL
jgi:hypothetical protein